MKSNSVIMTKFIPYATAVRMILNMKNAQALHCSTNAEKAAGITMKSNSAWRMRRAAKFIPYAEAVRMILNLKNAKAEKWFPKQLLFFLRKSQAATSA